MKSIASFLYDVINIPAVVRNLYRHRELIRILTWRDYQARFRGSLGGILWSIAQPLFMMVIYTLVFSTFLKVRFGSSESPYTFAVYLLCGLLPWNAFAEGLSLSTNLIRGNSNLVKKVVFPLEILPFNMTLVTIIQQVIGFFLLLGLAWIVNGRIPWQTVFAPIIILIEIILLSGINWIWSGISVFLPDMRQITPVLTSVLIFMTPVFYPEDMIPAWASWIMKLNPLAHLVGAFRDVLIHGKSPFDMEFIMFILISIVFTMVGYLWYSRVKGTIAENL